MTSVGWDELLSLWDAVARLQGPHFGKRAGVLFGCRTKSGWEFLLGQRRRSSDFEALEIPKGIPCGRGSWCGPGGVRDHGESLLECALRETLEEFFDVYPVPAPIVRIFFERLNDYLPPELRLRSLSYGYSSTFHFTVYFVPLATRPSDEFWKPWEREFFVPPSPQWFTCAQVLGSPRRFPAEKWPDWPQPYYHVGLIEVIEDLQDKGVLA